MGTKYPTQTIVGYNASPPSDDGTASESNRVNWSKHKTKLGDPVKTLAEAINTALVSHVDTATNDKSLAYTTVAADHGRLINVTAGITISLGDAGTMGADYLVFIKNSHTAAITVDLATAGDTLDGTAAGSVSLAANTCMVFKTTAAANGYLKLAQYQDPDTSVQLKVKSADESVSSSTVLQDDDHLTGFSVEAGETYFVEVFLNIVVGNATPDIKIYFDVTGVPDILITGELIFGGSFTGNTSRYVSAGSHGSESFSLGSGSGGRNSINMSGLFVPATTESFNFQWAQNISDAASVTLKKGSFIRMTKVT